MQKSEAHTKAQEAKKRLAEALNDLAQQRGLGSIAVGMIRLGSDYTFRADVPTNSADNLPLPASFEGYQVQYDFIGPGNEVAMLENQLHRISEAKQFLWDLIDEKLNALLARISRGEIPRWAYSGQSTFVIVREDQGYYYLVGVPVSDESLLPGMDLPTEHEGFPVRYMLESQISGHHSDLSLNIRPTR